jgi:hypothetical protein
MDNHQIPPGAILLGAQQPVAHLPPPRSRTEVLLRSTHVSFDPVVDDDNIVRGYRQYLHDVLENTYYILGFAEDTLVALRMRLDELPGEGFPLGDLKVHQPYMSRAEAWRA